jgi:intraflagellar transport protein 80
MNIKLYRWERALEIATQNSTHVDTVVAYRQRFLQQQGQAESNDKFLQLAQNIDVDWETIKAKIRADKDREIAAAQ